MKEGLIKILDSQIFRSYFNTFIAGTSTVATANSLHNGDYKTAIFCGAGAIAMGIFAYQNYRDYKKSDSQTIK